MKNLRPRSDCPISSLLDIIGDKWSLLIVRDILMNGKNTYNEFLNSKEGIATNILADRLSTLEKAGILAKEAHPESKAKIYYRLTNKGIDLLPLIVEIILWSNKHINVSPNAKEYILEMERDKQTVITNMMNQLKKK